MFCFHCHVLSKIDHISLLLCVNFYVGTLDWIDRLKWPGAENWKLAARSTLDVDDTIQGFVKNYGNFWFYWINNAGHMVV